MSIFKELYRKTSDFYIDPSDHTVGGGLTFTWEFKNPGWVAFDFMCNIPISNSGLLPNKWFTVEIDGVVRFRVRGPWAWQRNWLYVDSGEHTVKFYTEGYSGSDYAKIRRINLTDFSLVTQYAMIEATKMPKPLETIQAFNILSGWQRYQRTGQEGSEIEFGLIFDDLKKWRAFMQTLENFYIIKGDYGVYGGTITPQDVDITTKGSLILMKCKMLSPLQAGVGVDGV